MLQFFKWNWRFVKTETRILSTQNVFIIRFYMVEAIFSRLAMIEEIVRVCPA